MNLALYIYQASIERTLLGMRPSVDLEICHFFVILGPNGDYFDEIL